MTGFQEQFGWPTDDDDSDIPGYVSNQMGWIMSTFALGAIFGSPLAGVAADRLGRKGAIQVFAFVFTIGAFFQLFCHVLTYLYIGRILGGIGVGALSAVGPMYMSEIAPAYMRGAAIALMQLSITFGIFVASAANMGLQFWHDGWRISYAGNGAFSIAVLFLMSLCVESPRCLVKSGDIDGAHEVLMVLRHEEEIEPELQDILCDEKLSQTSKSMKWKDLFTVKRNMRFRTLVGMCVLGLQQFSGINVTFYFAPIIFSKFLSSEFALGAMVVLCFVNFFSTIFSVGLVESIGRRPLMIFGAAFMALFSFGIAVFTSPSIYINSAAIVALILILNALYVISFELSWGPIGWIIPSEMFPLELRGKAVSLCTACNWICNFLVGRMTPILIRPKAFDIYGTYVFFGACCLGLTLFSFLSVAETQGIELEHMDKVFRDFRKNSLISRVAAVRLLASTSLESTSSSSSWTTKEVKALQPQESLRNEATN